MKWQFLFIYLFLTLSEIYFEYFIEIETFFAIFILWMLQMP